MDKIAFTLVRYLLTAAGATEAAASDDVVTKIAAGIVTLASVLWGLFEARHHAALAAAAPKDSDDDSGPTGLTGAAAALCLLLPALVLAGCAGSTNVSSDPATSFRDGAQVAAPLLEGAVRLAVPRILAEHPELEEEFAASSSAASALIAGSAPDAAAFASALRAAFPKLAEKDAESLGIALESAWKSAAALYKSRTGRDFSLSGNSADASAQGGRILAEAFVRGLAEGLADARNAASGKESAR